MRPIRKKATPVGVFPKRFLISTLRQLDREVGLTVPTLVAPPNGSGAARALPVRVHVYRNGRAVHQLEVAADPRRPCVEVWQREWEAGLAASNAGEDLIAVEYLHAPEDAPWLGPRMGCDLLSAICVAARSRSIDATRAARGRPFDRPNGRPQPPALALAGLEARIGLVDDVDPALAAHDAAVLVPFLGRFQ